MSGQSGPAASAPDVSYHEILAGYFGFPVARYADEPSGAHPGTRRFDREEIGRARYDAAQASLSRAVRRLEARGLVGGRPAGAIRRPGVKLTDTGLEVALEVGRQETRALVDEVLGRTVLTVCAKAAGARCLVRIRGLDGVRRVV